jgi:hypothetical protein
LSLLLSSCSSIQIPWITSSPEVDERVDLIAVMPIKRTAAPVEDAPAQVAPEAENVVTSSIYGALSSTYEWRFVPDLTVADAMRNIGSLDPLDEQALALGKAVEADGVLFGSVWRYVERVGNDDSADEAAAVAFRLRLLSVRSGKVVWEQSFERTQTSPRSTMLEWVPFWEPGPRWATAVELTHQGVDQLLEDLRRSLD